jgi:hypothetical protein
MTTTPNPIHLQYTDVVISAVVAITDRPNLIPKAGSFIQVAVSKTHHDWEEDRHGQIIPSKTKTCYVKKVAKNGSFLACGRWYRSLITQAWVHSNIFGTSVTYF